MYTTLKRHAGFTLLEVLVALVLLATICSTLFVVVDRCMAAVTNMTWERRAFDVARENLEQILSRTNVEENTEYGQSEQYPQIEWKTTIESFSDPIYGNPWLRAVCSADYEDASGQTKTVELTHWLTQLTEAQAGLDGETLTWEEQTLATEDKAAEYCQTDVNTIRQYVENGMAKSDENQLFIKYNLDIFVSNQGDPNDEDKARQVHNKSEYDQRMKEETASDPNTMIDSPPSR